MDSNVVKKTLSQPNAGFTLIEMVAVIAISGILAAGMVTYIGDAVIGYESSASRNKLAQSGRAALDRLSVELHNSLPNSLRVSTASGGGNQCLEFVPVLAATTYINPPFDAAAAAFDVVQFEPNVESVTDGYIAIYPTKVNEVYDAEHSTTTGFPVLGALEQISSIADTSPASTQLSRVTLASSHRFSERSPSSRLFYVNDPISYCVSGSRLYRYTDYGFFDVQPTVEAAAGVCVLSSGDRCLPSSSSGGSKMLITDAIDNSSLTAFRLIPQTLARNALVAIEMNFASQGDRVRLNHQVLTRSVP
ncbi:prepilin-type N-terminal cleavage/methylation domain-containing protein [Gammaproteobacteria bacterium]|nr:prepilin-type N-terminal cleavage/methylation domain-containing protein [Gammaproteobacteria bacterium]